MLYWKDLFQEYSAAALWCSPNTGISATSSSPLRSAAFHSGSVDHASSNFFIHFNFRSEFDWANAHLYSFYLTEKDLPSQLNTKESSPLCPVRKSHIYCYGKLSSSYDYIASTVGIVEA